MVAKAKAKKATAARTKARPKSAKTTRAKTARSKPAKTIRVKTAPAKRAGRPVLYRSSQGIATITLNRPDAMNRLNTELVDGLHAAWERFMASDDRVAVLTASGDRAFTAGADLDSMPRDLFRGIPGVGVPVDKPVIGAVTGWCVGGGMVLTTMCDILVITENTRFIYPEVKVGYSGGLIATLAVRIPHKIAMELVLVGDPIDAQRAYEVGYANQVVPEGKHKAVAMEYARKIAATAPLPSTMLKQWANDTVPKGPSEIAGIARMRVDRVNSSKDGDEGIAAFREKRAPVFRGR